MGRAWALPPRQWILANHRVVPGELQKWAGEPRFCTTTDRAAACSYVRMIRHTNAIRPCNNVTELEPRSPSLRKRINSEEHRAGLAIRHGQPAMRAGALLLYHVVLVPLLGGSPRTRRPALFTQAVLSRCQSLIGVYPRGPPLVAKCQKLHCHIEQTGQIPRPLSIKPPHFSKQRLGLAHGQSADYQNSDVRKRRLSSYCR
jgi:hypothetical protein